MSEHTLDLMALRTDVDLLQEVLYKSKEGPEITVDGHGRITRAVPANYITELKGRIDKLDGEIQRLNLTNIVFGISLLASILMSVGVAVLLIGRLS